LRVRWEKKQADKTIFEAAYESENRYNEVETGTRRATSRSPFVGLVTDTARQFREQSLTAGRPSLSRATQSTSVPTIKFFKSPNRRLVLSPKLNGPIRSRSSESSSE
jgi:hypothetical protein